MTNQDRRTVERAMELIARNHMLGVCRALIKSEPFVAMELTDRFQAVISPDSDRFSLWWNLSEEGQSARLTALALFMVAEDDVTGGDE